MFHHIYKYQFFIDSVTDSIFGFYMHFHIFIVVFATF